MKVICAGMSKTGTKSMVSALTILGYSVHDAGEQWFFHMDEYVGALESNEMPDFASMYANVDAVTDIPANKFFEEIFHAFPSSKVVLMIRDDEEAWLKSLLKTMEIWDSLTSKPWVIIGFIFTPTGRKLRRLIEGCRKLIFRIPNESDPNESYKSAYRGHNERVRSVIPQEKLLVFNVKEGWKPLCEFLGIDVPDVPFPHLNRKSDLIATRFYSSPAFGRVYNEVVFTVTVVVILLAVLVLLILS